MGLFVEVGCEAQEEVVEAVARAGAADGAIVVPINQWAERATLGTGSAREGGLVVVGKSAVDHLAVGGGQVGKEGGKLVGDKEHTLAAAQASGGHDAARTLAVEVERVGNNLNLLGKATGLWGEEVVFVEDTFAKTQMVTFEEDSAVAAEYHADEGEGAREQGVGVVVGHAVGVGGGGEGIWGEQGGTGLVETLACKAEHILGGEVAVEGGKGIGLQPVVAIEEEDIFAAGMVETSIARSRETAVRLMDNTDAWVGRGIAFQQAGATVGGAIINAYSLEVGIGLAE